MTSPGPSSGPSPARGPLAAGLLLVLAGAVLLAVQVSDVTLDWPIWIVVAGVATIGIAVAIGFGGTGAADVGQGFAAVGGILLAIGLVLSVQEETGAYASWAYAWALVAPGGVGFGLLVFGLVHGRGDVARAGLSALVSGLVLFLVFFVVFEGFMDLTTLGDEWLTGSLAPLTLVGLGVLFVVVAVLPPRWRGASGRAPTGDGSGPERSSSAAAGAAASGADSPTGDLVPLAVDVSGAQVGEVTIAFGAGRLAIGGPAAPGRLVEGSCFGGLRRDDQGPGRVRLSTPSEEIWTKAWDQAPFDWRLGLSGEVPLRLSIETGAARTDADLSALLVTELRIRTGASETSVVLPTGAGYTRVEAEGGAATVRLRVPDGVAARIRSTMAIGTTDVDTMRFPRDPSGGWASPDFEEAANRVEIDVRGGLGSVSIR